MLIRYIQTKVKSSYRILRNLFILWQDVSLTLKFLRYVNTILGLLSKYSWNQSVWSREEKLHCYKWWYMFVLWKKNFKKAYNYYITLYWEEVVSDTFRTPKLKWNQMASKSKRTIKREIVLLLRCSISFLRYLWTFKVSEPTF